MQASPLARPWVSVIAPAFAALGLLAPNVIAIFSPLAPYAAAAADQAPAMAGTLWQLHRAAFSIGLSLIFVAAALGAYRGSFTRRALHLGLFLILLELFYRLAYGGAVSPGLLRSVPETSRRETLELLAGHPALTFGLSLVMLLAIYASIASWRSALRPSWRLCGGLGLAGIALILISLVLGAVPLRASGMPGRAVLAETQAIFPIDIVTAFGSLGSDWDVMQAHAASRAAFRFANPRLLDAGSRQASEIYVIVIGETSRRANWSLFGYPRDTTPRLLAMRDELIVYPRMTSNATNTILSLPLTLTRATPETRATAASEKSIVTLLRQAGFQTFWISNQERSGLASNPITRIAAEAGQVSFTEDEPGAPKTHRFDSNLLPRMDRVLAALAPGSKAALFLHMEGSHFGYKERYPADFERFPDGRAPPRPLPEPQMRLVNEYDNSIGFTDANLRAIIERLQRCGCRAGMIFFSDHGERLFDHGTGDTEFGHGFPTISRPEIEVPFLIWLSDAYRMARPRQVRELEAHASAPAQLTNLFETIVDLAEVDYDGRTGPGSRPSRAASQSASLFSEQWSPPQALSVLTLEEKPVTLPTGGGKDPGPGARPPGPGRRPGA